MRPPATSTEIAVRYTLFAAVAIAANLLAQAVSLALYRGHLALVVAMAVGTIVGLAVKFQLDRRLIFHAPPAAHSLARGSFLFYASTGVITTAIFWAVESFAYLASGGAPGSEYAGGFVGLTIGYVLKYRLDKRFVFRSDAQAADGKSASERS